MRRYVNGNRAGAETCVIDTGPPERWRHGTGEKLNGGGVRSLEECVLDRWLMVGGISPDEHAAGLKLRADYHIAKIRMLNTRQFDPDFRLQGNFWQSAAEKRSGGSEDAYQRWGRALRHVGTGAAGLLITVCCEDGHWPWARRHELRAALQVLAKHYGY